MLRSGGHCWQRALDICFLPLLQCSLTASGPWGIAAYAPEGGLDFNNIRVGDGSFSDGNGPLSELYALRALYEQEAGS